MSEYSKEVENAAKNAFESPSQLTARRLGRRTPTLPSSSPILGASSSFGGGGGDDRSVRSRRSQSLITSSDSAEIFDQMHSATTVQVGGGGVNRPSPLTIGSVIAGATHSKSASASSPIAELFSFASSMGSNSISNSRDNGDGGGGGGGVATGRRPSFPLPEDHDDGENYFSSGGALSIDNPGKVNDEKDVDDDDDDSDYSDDDDNNDGDGNDEEVTGINTRKVRVAAQRQAAAAVGDEDAYASPKTTKTTTTAPKKKVPPPAIKVSSSMSPTTANSKKSSSGSGSNTASPFPIQSIIKATPSLGCQDRSSSTTTTAELVKTLVVEHGTTTETKKKLVKKRKSIPEMKKSTSPVAGAAATATTDTTKKVVASQPTFTSPKSETSVPIIKEEKSSSSITTSAALTEKKSPTSPRKKSSIITSLPVLPVTPKSPTKAAAATALAKKKKKEEDDELKLIIASVAAASPAPVKSSIAAAVAGDEKKQHDDEDLLLSAPKSETTSLASTTEKSSTLDAVATGALSMKQQQQQDIESTAPKSEMMNLALSNTEVSVGSPAKKEQECPPVPPIKIPPTATASKARSLVLDTVSAAIVDTEFKLQDAADARAASKARVAAALFPLLELSTDESLSSPPNSAQVLVGAKAPLSPMRTRQVPPPVGAKAPLSPPRSTQYPISPPRSRQVPPPAVGGKAPLSPARAASPMVFDFGIRRAPSPLVLVDPTTMRAPSPIVLDVGPRRAQSPLVVVVDDGSDYNRRPPGPPAPKGICGEDGNTSGESVNAAAVATKSPQQLPVIANTISASQQDNRKIKTVKALKPSVTHVKVPDVTMSLSDEKKESSLCESEATPSFQGNHQSEKSKEVTGDLFWEPSDAILSDLRTITEEDSVGTDEKPVDDNNNVASTGGDVFYTPAKEQPPTDDIFHTPAQEEFFTPTFHTAEMARLPSPPSHAPSLSEDGSTLDAFDLMVAPTMSLGRASSATQGVERTLSKHFADIQTPNHAVPRADSDITDQMTTQPVESYSDLGIAFSTTNLSAHFDGNAASRNLKYNDSDFHLLANQLVKFFQSKAVDEENKMILTSIDRDKIQQILPAAMLLNFIEAVRFRLRSIPSEPSTTLHFLMLQCNDLGMDREGAQNPVFVALSISDHQSATIVIRSRKIAVMDAQSPAAEFQPQTKPVVPTAAQSLSADASTTGDSAIHIGTIDETSKTTGDSMSDTPFHIGTIDETSKPGDSSAGSAFAAVAPVSLEEHQAVLAEVDPFAVRGPLVPDATTTTTKAEKQKPSAFVPPAEVGKSDQSLDGSLLTGPDNNSVQGNSVQGNASTGTAGPEITRQQLLAELREASNLMAESENPETAQFWRAHVLDLQARLRALHGDGTSVASHTSQKTPEDILESNRRVVSEFQRREQYLPPNLDSPDLTQHVPPKPVQPFEYDAPMVDVVAPADLPGGYHFEAEIEGTRFLATVPPGGVQQGETFTCYMRELNSVAIDIPVGYWKDNMSNVFKYGCCHPVPWHGLFCPLFALSQVGHRVQLDFLGRSSPPGDSPRFSNRTMVLMVTSFWVFMNLALFGGYNLKWSRGLEISFGDLAAFALVNLSMFGFTVFVTQSTRYSLREKFMIREDRCYDLEDVVVSTFCLPCTVCQMARHTANYDDYEAVCCSKSGLPDNVRVNQGPREQENDPTNYTMMV